MYGNALDVYSGSAWLNLVTLIMLREVFLIFLPVQQMMAQYLRISEALKDMYLIMVIHIKTIWMKLAGKNGVV